MNNPIDNRVTIRPVELADAKVVQQYASDPRVAATTNVPHPYPDGGGMAFVERAADGWATGRRYAFAILCSGVFAGIITLNAVDQEAGTAELDYWVAPRFWNQGVGATAAAQAIGYAFNQMGLSTLSSACLEDNTASARLLEKNGFVLVHTSVNDGRYGAKFQGRPMKRFQLSRK